MANLQFDMQKLKQYFKHLFFSNFHQQTVIRLPHFEKIGSEEYSDLEFYHNTILNKLKFHITIEFNTNNTEQKKQYLLNTLGPYHAGYKALMRLSDNFWNNFNFLQILFIAKMYNQYPIIPYGFKKPLIKRQKKSKFWILVHKNRYNQPYLFHAMDCFRLTIATLGLSDSNEYGYANYNNFYSTYIVAKQYPDLSNNLLNCFELHCAELLRYGYKPLSKTLWTYTSAYFLLKTGDIVYTNPLEFGHQSWEDMRTYTQLHFEGMIISKIMDDIKVYGLIDTGSFNLSILKDAIRQFLEVENVVPIGNLSNYDLAIIKKKVLQNLQKILTDPKTFEQLQNHSLDIQKKVVEHNQYSDLMLEKLNFKNPKGKLIKPKRSKFHVFLVLEATKEEVVISTIDGANPLLPMSITNIQSISRDMDKVVIFRHQDNF